MFQVIFFLRGFLMVLSPWFALGTIYSCLFLGFLLETGSRFLEKARYILIICCVSVKVTSDTQ